MKGFTGKNCETDFDKCASNPCQNNATCMDKVNAYKCLCLDGYAGRRCEVKGVMCYTCSYVWSADTANTRECVYDPEQVTIGTKATPCSYPRYCTTIKRVDYQLPTPKNSNQTKGGDIWSFVRMCDTVNRGNKCLKDVKAQSETCYSTCRENYCNNGDGSKITGISGSSTVTMSYVLVGLFARIAFINM
ncbi:hypothetical protein LSAT2_008331 [Lamellibrachia satsuma]|nr:hypothetical protein LSAT2_008331 [Lamellibrachia satsuma]